MLGIECAIESLYVTLYFPLSDEEPLKLKDNFTRVEWHVDSLNIALDVAGESQKGLNLLEKYRMREEQELKITNLDEGSVVKDSSAGPFGSELHMAESREESSPSDSTSETIQMNDLATEHGNIRQGITAPGKIIPLFETVLPPSTQPVVIEFLNLPLRTGTSTLVLKFKILLHILKICYKATH